MYLEIGIHGVQNILNRYSHPSLFAVKKNKQEWCHL